jgi:hypothetical protein
MLGGSLLRRHRLSIIGQNFLQTKKLIAAMSAKTRRIWTSYVTLVDRLCYPHPHGINLFISKLTTKCQKLCYPYSHRIRSFYIQTQFEKISIEHIIFMLQIVTNMNETLIILHLQQITGI